jgi:hypothetical protein
MRNSLPGSYLPHFLSAQDNLVQREVQDAKLIKESKQKTQNKKNIPIFNPFSYYSVWLMRKCSKQIEIPRKLKSRFSTELQTRTSIPTRPNFNFFSFFTLFSVTKLRDTEKETCTSKIKKTEIANKIQIFFLFIFFFSTFLLTKQKGLQKN